MQLKLLHRHFLVYTPFPCLILTCSLLLWAFRGVASFVWGREESGCRILPQGIWCFCWCFFSLCSRIHLGSIIRVPFSAGFQLYIKFIICRLLIFLCFLLPLIPLLSSSTSVFLHLASDESIMAVGSPVPACALSPPILPTPLQPRITVCF